MGSQQCFGGLTQSSPYTRAFQFHNFLPWWVCPLSPSSRGFSVIVKTEGLFAALLNRDSHGMVATCPLLALRAWSSASIKDQSMCWCSGCEYLDMSSPITSKDHEEEVAGVVIQVSYCCCCCCCRTRHRQEKVGVGGTQLQHCYSSFCVLDNCAGATQASAKCPI